MMIFKSYPQLTFTLAALAGLIRLQSTSVALSPNMPQEPPPVPATANESPELNYRAGVLVTISLPVTSVSAAKTKLTLQRIVESAPSVVRPEDRLVVVLEFDTGSGKTGRGSELEACQMLARYLATSDLNRVETIAFVPAATKNLEPNSTQLTGHAVLIAIAANQLALGKDVSIGAAGIDEQNIDNLVRDVYRGIASQRLTLPVPVVMSMLQKDQPLYRVRTTQGIVFVNGEELTELESSGQSLESTTISEKGSAALLTGQQLADFRLLRYLPGSRADLASQVKLAPHTLDRSLALEDEWRAVQVNFPTFIDERVAQWMMRSLGSQIASRNGPNLVILNLDGSAGDLDACLKLARYLVDLDHESVQSVAYVRGSVRGPAALLALSCDQLIMATEAKLGGKELSQEKTVLSPEAILDLQPMVKSMAKDKQQDWSLMLSMLDPNMAVVRFRHNQTGQFRLLSTSELEQLDDATAWDAIGPVDEEDGLSAVIAEQMLVARTIADDEAQVQAFYQLEQPPRILQTSTTDRYVEKFARFLSRGDVSMLLLFAAVFLLSSEMSVPGVGVPGFLSAICFMLFFWSHYLDGNAHWLEILMFLVGVVFLGIELLVLPGFGIFGVGGILLIAASLVLASQSFLLPRSSAELARLPQSLLPLVGAGLGFFAAIYVLRKVLPNSPYLKNLILAERKPRLDTGLNANIDPEAIVDWSYLSGQRGEAITRLMPSGKARIAGKVYNVITEGRMVDKGQPIRVIEAVGNRVVVKLLED